MNPVRIAKWLFGWGPTFGALLVVSIAYGAMNWPASWWFRNVVTFVHDAQIDEPVFMEVNREIRRPFFADWSVIVRRLEIGGWTIVCTAHGKGDYLPGSTLPDPLALEWWTDGQCSYPPPGRLYLTTIWRIQGPTGPRPVVVTSNIFEVTASP